MTTFDFANTSAYRMVFVVASKSFTYRAPVSEERIDEFLSGIYGKNKKSNNAAVKKALKSVLFGVAAEAWAINRRGRR